MSFEPLPKNESINESAVEYAAILEYQKSRLQRKYGTQDFASGSPEWHELEKRANQQAITEALENIVWKGDFQLPKSEGGGRLVDENELIGMIAVDYDRALGSQSESEIPLATTFPNLSPDELRALAWEVKRAIDRLPELVRGGNFTKVETQLIGHGRVVISSIAK